MSEITMKFDETVKAMIQGRNDKYGPAVAEALKKRGFEAWYCPDREAALAKALEIIPAGSSVGWGGSMSISQIGLKQKLQEGGYTLLDRDTETTPEGRVAMMRRIFAEADFFIGSSNAVTEDGMLLNVDGYGNRTAAYIFGPTNVLLVCGINKVVRDLDAAKARIRSTAAPVNMNRFDGLVSPCRSDGKCHECMADDCICNYWVTTRRCSPKGRIKVLIVGEDLGF